MLRFTRDHEWISVNGDVGTIGITPFAQEKLGDLVFVELPGIGAKLSKGAVAATVESVKAASEVYAPVAGEVLSVNGKLEDEPGLVNAQPTSDGWLFKMKIADATELDTLLDEQGYKHLTTGHDGD